MQLQDADIEIEVPLGIEPTATALAMAIVRVYAKDNKTREFKNTNLGGIGCYITDRKRKSRYLRVYDVNTSEMLFETELYVNFVKHYTQLNDKFFCFPIISAVIGIEFANANDAATFQLLIEKYCF